MAFKNESDIDQYLKQNLLEQSLRLQAIQQNSKINYLKAKNRLTPTVNMGVVRSKTAETEQYRKSDPSRYSGSFKAFLIASNMPKSCFKANSI